MADYLHCKIGTQPAVAIVHGRDKIIPGRWIRIKESGGDKWHKVFVTSTQGLPDGKIYFMADR